MVGKKEKSHFVFLTFLVKETALISFNKLVSSPRLRRTGRMSALVVSLPNPYESALRERKVAIFFWLLMNHILQFRNFEGCIVAIAHASRRLLILALGYHRRLIIVL